MDITAVEALRYSAVQLFDDRARATVDGFVLDDADVPAVLEICRRLDGMPLALELAAARVDAFGLKGLAAQLDDRFAVLTNGRRTALPRHQTLRAAMDWSYELLPQIEQLIFRRLAIFRGSFTMEAAAAIAADERINAAEVMESVANLAGKSLITTDIGSDITYHRLLDTTRSYALDKLGDRGEHVARRHAEFFRDLVPPTALSTSPAVEDMARYGREIDNVRAALDWSFGTLGDALIGVVLTARYVPVWLYLALIGECRERTYRALECLEPEMKLSAQLQMQLHLGLGLTLNLSMGSVESARIALANALEFAESLGDLEAQLLTLWAQWVSHCNTGECRATRSIAERFSAVARRTGDRTVTLVADRLMGYTLQHEGEQREAQHCFERVLDLYFAPADQRYSLLPQFDQRVLARAMLARVLWLQGYVDQAIDQARRSLEDAKGTDYELSICEALRLAVCPVTLMTGDFAAAARAVAMLIEVATNRNATFWKIVGHCLKGKLLIMRGEFRAGADLLRVELEMCEKGGWAVWFPEFLGALAEGLAGLGRLTEALATVDQGLERADRGGERYYVAELLRIKGELLLRQAGEYSVPGAEDCFHGAQVIAQEQGALFWELRTALSLARLRVRQERQDDAREILAPVYARFTEGFETADLKHAKALLEQLA